MFARLPHLQIVLTSLMQRSGKGQGSTERHRIGLDWMRSCNETGWIGHNEMDGTGRDWTRQGGLTWDGQDGTGRDGTGTGWDGMGRDGMGRDRTGLDGAGWDGTA